MTANGYPYSNRVGRNGCKKPEKRLCEEDIMLGKDESLMMVRFMRLLLLLHRQTGLASQGGLLLWPWRQPNGCPLLE